MNREEAEKLISMNRAFELLRRRQKEMIKRFPEIKDLASQIRSVRAESVGNSDLLNQAVENLSRKGFDVYTAKDAREAIEKILELVDDEQVVAKSKSNVTKEIRLVEELEKRGIEVVETDVGDRILQILNENPSHPTGPAAHLSTAIIAERLSEHFSTAIEADARRIVEFLRKDIVKRLEKASVGITGANAITREGAVVILHNEGNVFEVINRPKRWIIVTGIDKIYPSIEHAVSAAKVQSFYATGEILPSFVEIISGYAKTADIEKRLVKSGTPENVSLILLDNGRSEIASSEFREVLYCLGCGSCVANCPAHAVYGSRFQGGRFALVDALRGDRETLRFCLSCRRCKKNCPLEIDIPSMISRAREGSELFNFLVSHAMWLNERIRLEMIKITLKLGL